MNKLTVSTFLPVHSQTFVSFECPHCKALLLKERSALGLEQPCHVCEETYILPRSGASELLTLVEMVDKKFQVGTVNVVEQQFRHDSSFQTASHWEQSVSAMGVFPVYVGQDYYNKNRFYFYAELPAVIVEDFFPNSFGGVIFGTVDSFRNTGNPARPIVIQLAIEAKNLQFSRAYTEGCEWSIDKETFPAIREMADYLAKREAQSLANYWKQYSGGDSDTSIMGASGMTAHCAEYLSKYMRVISAIDGRKARR